MGTRYIPGKKSKEKRLEIYTLGQFQVIFDGRPLFADNNRAHKIGELFMYLITHKGKQAPSETIVDTLWPDQEYANPKNTLKNMIYRLKQGLNEIQVLDAHSFINTSYGGYGWNTQAPYWLDADEFETLCRKARDLSKTEPIQAANTYREALALYRGPYLAGLHYFDWILPRRHYYRQLFLRSVNELFSLQKDHQFFSQIVEDCENVLYLEDVEENIHLFYIEALLQEGKAAQARAHYEYITALLYQELGAKPSPAMQRVYRTIKAQSEKTSLDFNDLQEFLNEQDDDPGALNCDPEFFQYLCRLERRRAERKDLPVHLGIITLSGTDFRPLPADELKECMGQMQKLLLSKLRKGDVVSSWNDNQFTVMLPRLSLEQAEYVMQRLRNNLAKTCPEDKVILRSSIQPLLPWD